jgi:hypothetical protein
VAKSSAEYYEVRWRVSGSNEAWSAPQRVAPAHEIVVEDLDRTKTYEFEVRAVSACGAKSDWVSGTHTVPDVAPGTLTLTDIKTEADNAAADALAANMELANIASDNILSQGEKPVVIRDTNVITTEQAGIDTQATAFGVTTQKTAYDTAVTALTDYLATLTTPVLWSDLTGDTTIVGTTFRAKFADVYTTRQALLNAIYAAAKSKADAAQSTANAANANAPAVVNPQFSNGLTGWTPGNPTGWYVQTGGANLPDPIVNTAVVHAAGGGAATTDALYNAGHIPVVPGQQVTVTCCVNEVGANAGALGYARISWRNASNAEIGTSAPSGSAQYPTCGAAGTGTYTQCVTKVIAAAPAGAQFAVAEPTITGHTAGYFLFSNVCMVAQPSSVDELPDGSSYGKTRLSALVNGTIPIAGAGKDLLGNPTFIRNAMGVANGSIVQGAYSCDNWNVSRLTAGVWAAIKGSGNVLLRLLTGAVIPNSTQTNAFMHSETFPVTPGQTLVGELVTSLAYGSVPPAGITTVTRLYAQWTDAGGNYLGGSYFFEIGRTAGALTTRGSLVVPATVGGVAVAGAYAEIQTFATNTSGASWTAGALPYDMYINSCNVYSVQDLATEVTGTLSTQKNLPSVTFGNYGSGWSGLSLTYSATTTSATISASAATLQAGGDAINYSASSVTLSGTPGSVVKYYLYYSDAGMAGGSKTLQATTNQITALSNNSYVLLGSCTVTYPTSGTGGGGGSTGCPDENAWVLRADPDGLRTDWCVRANEVAVGHYLRLTDGRIGLVTYSKRKASDRVRVSVDGCALTCSTSAPLELYRGAGECVLAPESTGRWVVARFHGGDGAVRIERVEDVGPGFVQHITCENACFWTGDDPDYLFGHHNLKPGA